MRMYRPFSLVILVVAALQVSGWIPTSGAARAVATECSVGATDPPIYYAIRMVTTRRVSGARQAIGTANLTYASSPFGVAISPTGTYVYDLDIQIEKLSTRKNGVYAVWVTTPDLDQTRRLGVLDATMRLRGQVDWNKFLVVISLEKEDNPDAASWAGPIVLRGMSRSGLMHTMAGHGPFQQEPCAVYGFN